MSVFLSDKLLNNECKEEDQALSQVKTDRQDYSESLKTKTTEYNGFNSNSTHIKEEIIYVKEEIPNLDVKISYPKRNLQAGDIVLELDPVLRDEGSGCEDELQILYEAKGDMVPAQQKFTKCSVVNKIFHCHSCSKSFVNKLDCDTHILVHMYRELNSLTNNKSCFPQKSDSLICKGSKVCKKCDKPFMEKSACSVHKRLNIYKKLYSLNLTGRRVSWKSNLFSCDKCYMSFSSELLLKQHSHFHVPMKRFPCKQCFKSFSDKSSLQLHLVVHKEKCVYSPSHSPKSFPAESSFSHLIVEDVKQVLKCVDIVTMVTRLIK